LTLAFLDTNVLLRHFLNDHPDHSPRATSFLKRLEVGEEEVRVTDTVIFETVFTLERGYKQSKSSIRDAVLPLLELPGLLLPGKQRYRRIFDIYVNLNISFPDASYAVLCEQLGIEEIISFDRGFDRVNGLRRREP
jgi:uncharacterized protein